MRNKRVLLLLYMFYYVIIGWINLFAIDYDEVLLSDIARNIIDYKNKTVILKLRFKYIDNKFDKIVFYDNKNYDIVFDISKDKENKLKREILNLHEGMEYIVRFIVKNVGDFDNIVGELISFEPVLLFKLPEGLANDK